MTTEQQQAATQQATTGQATRPAPIPDERSAPFWEGAARGALMLQRCEDCGAHHFPVREVCTECLGESFSWAEASGRGTLHTFGVMHRLYHPGFAAELPYNIAVVELEEGPRMNSMVVGVPNEALRVGMPLAVSFREAGEVHVPVFEPAE